MAQIYGIKNCDTVKKARKWLEQNDISFTFNDFRSDGLEKTTVEKWLSKLDTNVLVNKRSTTWKQLSDKEKSIVDSGENQKALIALLIDQPTLIKRPVLEHKNTLVTGFSEKNYSEIFGLN